MEEKTARFTILIDADKKKAFDDLCAEQDVTSSQMIRRLIRDYLAQHGVPVRADGVSRGSRNDGGHSPRAGLDGVSPKSQQAGK